MVEKRWTDEHDEELRKLNEQGIGRNAAARQLGFGVTTVWRASNRLGLEWNREKTRKAVAAFQEDMKARRADLMSGLLDDAERMRCQLFEPQVVYSFGGRDNTFTCATVEEPSPADKRSLMTAIGTAVDKSVRLAEFDSENDTDKAKAALGALGRSLYALYGNQEEAQTPEADSDAESG
jgi:hypothetical protein